MTKKTENRSEGREKDKMERMRSLVELLNRARRAYEQEDKEIMANLEYDRLYDELQALEKELGTTLGEALLAPTKIYVRALRSIKEAGVTVKACSHITGGGFYENVPRMLKEGTTAVIQKDSYPIPPIFRLMAKKGNIEEKMMYNTYNMGIGMIVAVSPEDADAAMRAIKEAGETPYIVGHIETGEKGVTLC